MVVAPDDYKPGDFLWTLTFVFGTIFAVGPWLVPAGPNRAVYRIWIMQTAFCMFVTWATIYSSQMHPVEGPVFKNSTLSWLSVSWGNAEGIAPITIPTTSTTTTSTTTTSTTTSTTTTSTTTTSTTTSTTTTSTTTTSTTTTSTSTTTTTSSSTTTTTSTSTTSTTTTTTSTTTTSTTSTSTTTTSTSTSTTSTSTTSTSTTSTTSTSTTSTSTTTTAPYVTITNIFTLRDDYSYVYNVRQGDSPRKCLFEFEIKQVTGYGTVLLSNTHQKSSKTINCVGRGMYFDFKPDILEIFTMNPWSKLGHKFGPYENRTHYFRYYISYNDGAVKVGRDKKFNSPELSYKWLRFDCNCFSLLSRMGNTLWNIRKGITSKKTLRSGWAANALLDKEADEDEKSDEVSVITDKYLIFYEVIEEPIQFSVLIEDEPYREFYILLSKNSFVSLPHIKIHIGAHQGSACVLSKNKIVLLQVPCTMEWWNNQYLNFWVWYKDGEISVRSGYEDPDDYEPFLWWTEAKPFQINYYSFRSVAGDKIPMKINY